MAGVVVCHGSASVRERLVVTSIGVPSLAPVRAAATADELLALARRIAPTVVLLDAHLPGAGPAEAIRRLRAVAPSAAVVTLAERPAPDLSTVARLAEERPDLPQFVMVPEVAGERVPLDRAVHRARTLAGLVHEALAAVAQSSGL